LKDELNEIWQLLNRLCTPRLGKAPDMDLCRIVWTALQPASIRQLEVRLLARLNSVTSYGLIPALAGDCARSAPAWQQATQSPQNSQTFNPEAEAYAQRCAEEAGLS
jgi:hypothetical protein